MPGNFEKEALCIAQCCHDPQEKERAFKRLSKDTLDKLAPTCGAWCKCEEFHVRVAKCRQVVSKVRVWKIGPPKVKDGYEIYESLLFITGTERRAQRVDSYKVDSHYVFFDLPLIDL